MARRYFGTDGVRGIVGETLTPELVERLGRASTLWSGARPRLRRPRHARLRRRARGGVRARRRLGGRQRRPRRRAADAGGRAARARPRRASSRRRTTRPSTTASSSSTATARSSATPQEEQIEALLDAPAAGGGAVDRVGVATDSYLEHVLERFGSDLAGLRIAVDCANGAYSGIAPEAFGSSAPTSTAIGDEPDGTNINVGCGATDLALLARTVREQRARPRHRVRRGRRPDARGRRRGRGGGRRPDRRDPRARTSASTSSPSRR